MSKLEAREFWILNPIHDKPMVWSKNPTWVKDTIHTIEIAALQAANAKIQELEKLNVEYADLRVKSLTEESRMQKAELARLRDKITELEQRADIFRDKASISEEENKRLLQRVNELEQHILLKNSTQ